MGVLGEVEGVVGAAERALEVAQKSVDRLELGQLGTGLAAGVFWRDMGVVNLPGGRPTMQLTGGALKRLQALTPKGYAPRIDVTLTDEGPNAQALVIISAEPASAQK